MVAFVIGVPLAAGATTDQPPAPIINPASKFDVRAVDVVMSEPSDAASYAWTIDTTPPPPPSISGPPNPSDSPDATFTFSDADPTVTFHCRLDGNGFPACDNPKAYAGLDDGSHTLRVRAVDPAGNESQISTYTWTVDTVSPPTPTIDSGPPDPSGSKSAHFVFSDSENGVGFACRLDSASFSPCSSPKDYANLGDGAHSFTVKAVDGAGNESIPTSAYHWTIDSLNPVVTLSDKPPLITNQTTASFSFSSNKPSSTYECKLNGGGFSSCTSPRIYFGLDDGSHTFSVRATSLGNTGPTTEYTWTVDTVAPDTTITSTPPAVSNSASANFTFASSEAGSTFVCSIDAAGISPCASPKTYSGLGNGTHTFRVEAVDPAGNADGTAAVYSWQISGVGPATTDLTPPGNVRRLKRNVGYGVLKLAWAPPSDSDFDHVNVFVSTNPKTAPRTLVYKGGATKYTNRRFKNGLYYRYSIVSYDHAANASRGMLAVIPPSILLRSPREGRVVHSPPLLMWQAVAKATFYNVQLFYGGRKILSAWPSTVKLGVKRKWTYAGRRFQLKRGAYRWYVWPGFGPRSKARYGQLLGQSTFRVG